MGPGEPVLCLCLSSPLRRPQQGELPQEGAISQGTAAAPVRDRAGRTEARWPGQPFCVRMQCLTQRRSSSEGGGRETWLAQVLGLPTAHGPTMPERMQEVSPSDGGG